jgi:DGQHR domain-containing protein
MPVVADVLARRAIRMEQTAGSPLYLFSLTAKEILEIAEISRVSRGQDNKLIGYQRPEARRHIQEIVDYLDGANGEVLFPNSIIMALPSTVRFKSSRGPKAGDDVAVGGILEIPLPREDERKPGWIVDGQQRTLALARAQRQDLPVPVSAFVSDSFDVQRDQFVRINNTKPLPRGLVTELLPEIASPLPTRLKLRQMPSLLCDVLNNEASSPFHLLIRRSSMSSVARREAIVTDTSIVNMLQESLTTPSGCLFPYRNMTSGETDSEGIWLTLLSFWTAVKESFPEAWGRPPSQSRLMHGAGIRSMGRLMDRIMGSIDVRREGIVDQVKDDLALIASKCHWTSGIWDDLDLRWNAVENVPRHINELSNYLVRCYVQAKAEAR